MGSKKQNSRKKDLKWRFSSCWFSLICTLPYIFLSFIGTILTKFYVGSKYKKKFESTNMGLAHFKMLIFSDFSSMGVGLENAS